MGENFILNFEINRSYALRHHIISALQHGCQRTIAILIYYQIPRFTVTELRTMIKMITVQNQWVVNGLSTSHVLHDGGNFNIPNIWMHRVYTEKAIERICCTVYYSIIIWHLHMAAILISEVLQLNSKLKGVRISNSTAQFFLATILVTM